MEEKWRNDGIFSLGPVGQVKRLLLPFLERNSDVTEAHFDQNTAPENRKSDEQYA